MEEVMPSLQEEIKEEVQEIEGMNDRAAGGCSSERVRRGLNIVSAVYTELRSATSRLMDRMCQPAGFRAS